MKSFKAFNESIKTGGKPVPPKEKLDALNAIGRSVEAMANMPESERKKAMFVLAKAKAALSK